MNKRRLAARAGMILEDLIRGKTNFIQSEFMQMRVSEEDLRAVKKAADTLSWNCKRSLELHGC